MIIRFHVFLFILIFPETESFYKPWCYFIECCTNQYIPADFDKLEMLLKTNVFGQHLVTDNVVNALRAHWSKRNQQQIRKALALSFHGWPGGGKNYVAQFIQDSLYYYGSKSKYVHHFIGRVDFPLVSETLRYKKDLYNWIKGNVSSCPKQLFIFDEVDKMPPDVLNAIKPLIDYHDSVHNTDFRQAIFIFLSNTGSTIINNHVLKLWKEGRKREELKMVDFEKLISLGSFNEEGWLNKDGFLNNILRNIIYNLADWYSYVGGFHHSDTIKNNLIDHYFPFLPMEYSHVRLCIQSEFGARQAVGFTNSHIEEVMEFIDWGPEDEKIYSKTGCKRISQKVGMLVVKYNLYPKEEL